MSGRYLRRRTRWIVADCLRQRALLGWFRQRIRCLIYLGDQGPKIMWIPLLRMRGGAAGGGAASADMWGLTATTWPYRKIFAVNRKP